MQLTLPREDLYLPIDPRQRVVGILPDSATPMQSAAKVPILVAFRVVAQVCCIWRRTKAAVHGP